MRILPALLPAIYFVLLTLGAAFTPLWLDELHELVGTYRRSVSELLYWAQFSPGATPLNFFAQKLSLDAFGFSSLTVRLPAIAFGTASLWMFIRIAREHTKSRWLLAAIIFALLPHVFRYGVEGRPYSQGMFFALVAFWFWTRLEREPTTRDGIYLALAVSASLYSHVYSVFVAFGAALWSLRNRRSRTGVILATFAGCLSYVPWYFMQKAMQSIAPGAATYSVDWAHFSILGFLRELGGGGYFCSVPLLILAAVGVTKTRDRRLLAPCLASLIGPLAADAVMGYYFAGRQLIFALPFLVLLAMPGVSRSPKSASALLLIPLLAASIKYDFRQATVPREDWQTPAQRLSSSGSCVYVWSPDQLQYLQVYEPSLKQCDVSQSPSEILYVTTRYSPPTDPPKGYRKVQSERVGIAEIALYRRDDNLKIYGLSRFFFRQ
ncbi:MAG TPA: glycosyltransferase family 39 protein [Bryobacteraceae bacterium]|nr:glycosyltransferase family 39 protein [Bryobacteraceae bacterium]